MSAYLVNSTGQRAALGEVTARVGCSTKADIPIDPGFRMAELHYQIIPMAQGYVIEKLQDQLPLRLNGYPIQSAILKHGDVISAGSLDLIFQTRIETTTATSTMPPVLKTETRLAKSTLLFAKTSQPLKNDSASCSLISEESSLEATRLKNSNSLFQISDELDPYQEPVYSRLDLLKEAQNFKGALIACGFTWIFATFFYTCSSRLNILFFLPCAVFIGYMIGWLVKTIGSGLETRFGWLAAGTAILTVMTVNVLALAGLILINEASTDMKNATLAIPYEYSQNTHEISIGSQTMRSDGISKASATNLDTVANRATDTAREHEKSNPLSSSTSFDLLILTKSFLACIIMSFTAYHASFRKLTKMEISDLQAPL